MQLLRAYLDTLDVLPAAALGGAAHGTRVLVGGAITHIQRPPTARGVTFVNLEDETGMVNVVISDGLFHRAKPILLASRAIIVRGVVQTGQGTVSLIADQITHLDLKESGTRSGNFR